MSRSLGSALARLAPLLLLALSELGCASATSLVSARTLDPGAMQVGLSARAPWPVLEVGVRRGVAEAVEVGARFGGFYAPQGYVTSAVADTKIQLLRSASLTSGWDIAVNPALGYEGGSYRGPLTHAAHLGLTVLFGRNFSGGHQLILGPRATAMTVWDRDSERVDIWGAGGSLGFVFKLSDRFRLIPEGTLMLSPSSVNNSKALPLFQFGLGTLFDL